LKYIKVEKDTKRSPEDIVGVYSSPSMALPKLFSPQLEYRSLELCDSGDYSFIYAKGPVVPEKIEGSWVLENEVIRLNFQRHDSDWIFSESLTKNEYLELELFVFKFNGEPFLGLTPKKYFRNGKIEHTDFRLYAFIKNK